MLENSLTVKQYKKISLDLKNRGAPVLPSYDPKIVAEKQKCIPEGLESPKPGVYQAPMRSAVHFHLSRIIGEEVRAKINEYKKDPNNHFGFHHKFGADGFRTNSQYKGKIDQKTCYASYDAPLMLKVTNTKTKKSAHLYVNPNPNSWTSMTYLRLAYEKESDGKFSN